MSNEQGMVPETSGDGTGTPAVTGNLWPQKAIITITNQKGGVGKTTSAAALIDGLRRFYGLKVLAIDADPQCNLSYVQKRTTVAGSPTTKDWILGRDVIADEDGQALVPSTSELDDISNNRTYVTDAHGERPTPEMIVRRIHETMDSHGFDVAVIDTHPDLSIVTMGAIIAATHIVVPTQPEMLGIDGLMQELESIRGVGEQSGASWDGRIGVLITLYQQNTFMHRDLGDQLADVCENSGQLCFRHRISRRIQIPNQQMSGKDLYETSVERGAISDYHWWVDEVVDWVRDTSDGYDFDEYFQGFDGGRAVYGHLDAEVSE